MGNAESAGQTSNQSATPEAVTDCHLLPDHLRTPVNPAEQERLRAALVASALSGLLGRLRDMPRTGAPDNTQQ